MVYTVGCSDPTDPDPYGTTVLPPTAYPGCNQAASPSNQVALMQINDTHLRNQCGRGTSAASTMPYSYVAGVSSYAVTSIGTKVKDWHAPIDCNAGLVGQTPDCPTAAGEPGACLFLPSPVVDQASCGQDAGNYNCDSYNILCTKVLYDTAFQTACCLGQVEGLTSFTTPALIAGSLSSGSATSVVLPTDHVVCAPGWCPFDPSGACESVFQTACATSVTNDGGQTWVSALLADAHNSLSACGTWYAQATSGQAPSTRWPLIDSIIENYCSAHPYDTVSCGCFLYAGGVGGAGVCNDGSCYLYTSVTQGGAVNLRPVRPVDPLTSNTLNLSDYACIAPQCHGNTLLTDDVWAMQHFGRCPDVCLQVVTDGDVIMNGDSISGGVYVDVANFSCSGALASASVDTPYLMNVTNEIDMQWPHYASCPNCCPASNCLQEVPFVYALASNSADMYYTITADPLPPGVTIGTPFATSGALSNAGQNAVDFMLIVDGLHMPTGQYTTTVTIADVRPQYASCRASTVFNLTVFDADSPPPPQGPPVPNGGSGPPVVTKNVDPWWLMYSIFAALAITALLLLRQLILGVQYFKVARALKA